MTKLCNGVVVALLAGLVAGGCQSPARTATVAEYRPRTGPMENPAPYTDVYLLWRWVPARSQLKTGPSNSSVAHQMPVQVAQAYARRGSPVGFRRSDGQLIAIAGATTQPLTEAHYTWQTLQGETAHMDDTEYQPEEAVDSPADTIFTAVLGAAFDILDDVISESTDGDDSDAGYDHHSGRRHEGERERHSKPAPPSVPKKTPASQPWPR